MAVKQVKFQPDDTSIASEIKALQNEISNLKNLSHRRIIKYYESINEDSILSICLEYMELGSLSSYISNKGALDIEKTKQYTRCVLEGVAYLHAKKILHRDIKCANILLENIDNVKLADFGTAKQLKTALPNACSKGVGTFYWMAPEIVNGEEHNFKADIWSVGCSVIEMLTKRPPWYPKEDAFVVNLIIKETYPTYKLPEGCDEVEAFLQRCFVYSTDVRGSAAELLTTEFCS